MGSRLEANSSAVRKRIEKHKFEDEGGEEYESSKFGGFNDYFRRKKIKLQNLDAETRASSANKPPIFKGVVAHVNGYTQPSLNDLHKLIVSYGGGFMQYLDGKTTVTHIIASNLTPKKKVEFSKYRIVKPAWVVDSIEVGRLLPWDAYRVVEEGIGIDEPLSESQTDSVLEQETKASLGGLNTQTFATLSQPTPSEENASVEDYIDKDVHRFQADSGGDIPSMEEAVPFGSYALGRDNAVKLGPTNEAGPQHSLLTIETPCAQSDVVARHYELTPHGLDSTEAVSPTKPTAEEHNAQLLADPRVWKSTVVNPRFLKQYYEESRLHHLSAWKADLKSQLQRLAAEKTLSQKTREKRPPGSRRYILHVDFDSFFAAVSLLKFPQYVDKQVVITQLANLASKTEFG